MRIKSGLRSNPLARSAREFLTGIGSKVDSPFTSIVRNLEESKVSNVIDIGANVGAYSILASQETKCKVHSFEPHPETFQWLKRNINLQRIQGLVTAYNFGLGQENNVVKFSANLDCINHVLTNN
jgi:tRNA1(Val) A37 N6-methylase TrmN6